MITSELTKRYSGREVLAAARLEVQPGTVHALVGENGAGKSTLVKIIAGVVRADGGTLSIDGKPIELPRWDRIAARAAGVGIVQQHGSSAGTLTVLENAVLGVEPRRGPLLELDETADKLAALGKQVGLPIDPRARTETLSVGAAQRAEIVAALYHGAKLLILDEPTAVLTPVEVEGLLTTLRALASEGRTIIIVTHKLDEVRAVADAVTVLRAGKNVAVPAVAAGAQLDVAEIAKAMVGAELPVATKLPPPPDTAAEALGLAEVSVGRALVPLTLTVRAGEIVGVAGVDGNGQRELALAIAGLVKSSGRVRIAGKDVSSASPAHRLAAGLAHIPEDRHQGGLFVDGSVLDNLSVGRRDITGRWRLDRGAMRRHAEERIAELDIRPPDPDAFVSELSGGNQQKVVVARELSRPQLHAVIAAQPTRGVDLGAVARIHDRLRAAALEGAGVLVISADLDELLALCHRIVVLLRGAIVGELGIDALQDPAARATLGSMMTGASAGAA